MQTKLARMFDIEEAPTASGQSRSSDEAVERVLRASFWAPASGNSGREADVIDLASHRARLR